jgi:hypothetical protein
MTNIACFLSYVQFFQKKRHESRRETIWEEEEDQWEGRGGTREKVIESECDQSTLHTCIKKP